MQDTKTRRIVEVLIHIIGWGIVFGFPFLLMNRSDFSVSWMAYLRHGSAVPVSFLIVFYINYCFLHPSFLIQGTRQAIYSPKLNAYSLHRRRSAFLAELHLPLARKALRSKTSRTSQLDLHLTRRIFHDPHRRTGCCHPYERSMGRYRGCAA